MELHPPGKLSAGAGIAGALQRYLARLPLAAERRAQLEAHALAAGESIVPVLADVHARLGSAAAAGANPAQRRSVSASGWRRAIRERPRARC